MTNRAMTALLTAGMTDAPEAGTQHGRVGMKGPGTVVFDELGAYDARGR